VQQRTAELASAVEAQQAEIAERKRVEAQIQSSLQEKEVLLKEIHHRVKNNLQIISSLLSLQSENIGTENPVQTFRESQDRIKSMALIHEKLYQSKDISRIDFAEYVRSLTAYLYRSYVTAPGIEIAIDIQDMSLGIDTAIPCGLIINELVSNSLKYAFPDGRTGEIRIGLVRDGRNYTLKVSDDGAGLPPGLDFRNTPSLGLQLVNTLVTQLEGTIELLHGGGTVFRISFGEPGQGSLRAGD
jgi:two-component sensor histidine kinase